MKLLTQILTASKILLSVPTYRRLLRPAEIRCPRKSHPTRYLQRSVSTRIDNLPERGAGVRDFTLVPQLPLEFPVFPRKGVRSVDCEVELH